MGIFSFYLKKWLLSLALKHISFGSADISSGPQSKTWSDLNCWILREDFNTAPRARTLELCKEEEGKKSKPSPPSLCLGRSTSLTDLLGCANLMWFLLRAWNHSRKADRFYQQNGNWSDKVRVVDLITNKQKTPVSLQLNIALLR